LLDAWCSFRIESILIARVRVPLAGLQTMQQPSMSLADFREIAGATLAERVQPYHKWAVSRRGDGTWAFDKTLHGAPLPRSSVVDGCGRRFEGPNYCSQDYLSLASHPSIKRAVVAAIEEFGVHSAGSSALLGNTGLSRELEAELADFIRYEHVLLYPTGWAAGYGVIKGLVRPGDWVVMDALSHACLQEGARAATPKPGPMQPRSCATSTSDTAP
jgi:glycine C-acetyltransferase